MSDTPLPAFTYFDPVAASKVFAPTTFTCDACGEARGIAYTGPFYAIADEPTICAQCVASGHAAKTFGGSFNDVGIVWEAGTRADDLAGEVPASVLKEVGERTPGYESWQQGVWLFHCKDAAIFRGDATAEDVENVDPRSRSWWDEVNDVPWDEELSGYVPGGDIGVYRFDCRHCGLVMFHSDRS